MRFTVKRFALNLMFGVVLAAGSSVAGATTTNPSIKNESTSDSLTAAVLCATGFTSYCVTPATTTNPSIKNE